MTDVLLRFAESSGALDIFAGSGQVGRYVLERDAPQRESPRPYLHPIRTLSGTVVSDYRPADHDWHWGLSIAVANIAIEGEPDPVNLWGGVTYTADHGYVQLGNNGDQVHDAHTMAGDTVTERLSWRTASGREFLTEERTLRARLVDVDGRAPLWRLDVSSQWTNVTAGTLRFGSPTTAGRENAGYGGLFLRAAQAFAGGSVLIPPGTGGDPMGQTAPWLGLAHDSATVVLAADPSNPVAPTPWFVRTETPMLCAAPFFHDEWPLGPDATATWRWSVIVADGRLDATEVTALAGFDVLDRSQDSTRLGSAEPR